MKIRCAAKAVIVQDGQVLLQQCADASSAVYYELPGGGQRPGETMEAAVIRECLEETGYAVRVVRFLTLTEEILENEALVARHPGYAHRVFHVFQCEIIKDIPRVAPTEEDSQQVDIVWLPLEALSGVVLRPEALRLSLRTLVTQAYPAYFESKRIHRIV